MRVSILIAFCAFALWGRAQVESPINPPAQPEPVALSPDDPELAAIDQMWVNSYLNHYCFTSDRCLLNAFDYEDGVIPQFSQKIVAERLRVLDQETPFDLVYNATVQSFIDLYAVRRRDITEKVLGVSQLYFPYFEECLAKYNIPLEMKYLAVVESALNPSAISRAGAGGLWQFMVSTGKMYGLQVSSYQDERFDMYKSTDAACRYLRNMYDIYKDWQLVLAAYNSGPGNVNKAIRRAGGAKDFWSIKPFLPKETQGYVPAFIAVNYVMNYASEYNLYPAKTVRSFFETDTVKVRNRIEFSALAKVIDLPEEELAFLNATYKLREIPGNGATHYLVLPVDKVGLFLANEETVYVKCREQHAPPLLADATTTIAEGAAVQTIWVTEWKNHKVKRGETLGSIAKKYHVSVAEIKKWNRLKSTVLATGQNLKIETRIKKTVVAQPEVDSSATAETSSQSEESATPTTDSAPADEKSSAEVTAKASTTTDYKYYTVQRGDTLWSIAEKHKGVTVDSLRNLNGHLRDNKLVVGQKIKIKELGG